jgi:WD40 repeat protein
MSVTFAGYMRLFFDSSNSQTGQINLFTVRHEPGRLFHVMQGHRGPVSALALQHDERGFFSAGWDGQALVRIRNLHLRVVKLRVSFCTSNGTSIRDRLCATLSLMGHSWQRSQSVP